MLESILLFMGEHPLLSGVIVLSVPCWGGFVIIALRILTEWKRERNGGTKDQRLLTDILVEVRGHSNTFSLLTSAISGLKESIDRGVICPMHPENRKTHGQ